MRSVPNTTNRKFNYLTRKTSCKTNSTAITRKWARSPTPDTQINASLGHGGRHWICYTNLRLTGRGVHLLGLPQTKIGYAYRVTEKEFERLCEDYIVSSAILL